MLNEKSSKQGHQPRLVKLRYVLMPIVIIISALFILILLSIFAPKPAKKPIEIKAPLVEVVTLAPQQVTFEIQSQGSIRPRTQTSIISEVSGQIISVSDKFKVGGYFQKGEILLAIDDINYQVALVQAQSRVSTAKANLVEENAHGQQAKEEWLLSNSSLEAAPAMALRKPQLQKAQADLKSAKAELKQAKVRLTKTTIVAPYDAMIQEKHVDIGQYVSTGNKLAATFAVDYAEARLPIKQRDIPFLNLPQINQAYSQKSQVDLSLTIAGNSNHWSSFISRYEGVVDATSRVHYVIAQIDDPYRLKSDKFKTALPIGSFVSANINGKTVDEVIAIPRGAVHGANSLYMIDAENKLQIVTIDILRSDQQFVYSYDQLDPQLRLVNTQLETPVSGMTLRVLGEAQLKSESNAKVEEKTEQGE